MFTSKARMSLTASISSHMRSGEIRCTFIHLFFSFIHWLNVYSLNITLILLTYFFFLLFFFCSFKSLSLCSVSVCLLIFSRYHSLYLFTFIWFLQLLFGIDVNFTFFFLFCQTFISMTGFIFPSHTSISSPTAELERLCCKKKEVKIT